VAKSLFGEKAARSKSDISFTGQLYVVNGIMATNFRESWSIYTKKHHVDTISLDRRACFAENTA
jgi:hypothetical protein